MKGYNSNRMSSGAGRRTQRKQLQEGGRLQEGRKQIKTDNTRKQSTWKQSRSEAYYADMRKQNDSLRRLPKSDKHHLPTFPDTKKGRSDWKKFYTFSKDNQKLRDIRELGKKLRKKHGY
jgi:hypothetical protein